MFILCGLGVFLPATVRSQDYHVLHTQMGPADGTGPMSSLVEGTDGNFYGTTSTGGPFNNGTVFQITPAGVLTTLHSFTGGSDGSAPLASLVLGGDGNFYGTTSSGGGAANDGTVFQITPTGVLTTLHAFTGDSDGAQPWGALVQGSDGNFYGTTSDYGTTSGDGTIFRVTPAGFLTTIHRFAFSSDGARPTAALVLGSDGNFYGTASQGGPNGAGTIFRSTPTGGFTLLYSFNGEIGDGAPSTPLVQGGDGRFYGTTIAGGVDYDGGRVFAIAADGTFTLLVTFTSDNGLNPAAGLIVGKNGDLYGTTTRGGSNNDGTVFEVTTAGVLTTLHSFSGSDGFYPAAALVLGSDGNFYGTTTSGGSGGAGTVFALSPAGALTSLHGFAYSNDGAGPSGPLLLAGDGNFYGVTSSGGSANRGTVFRIGPDGTQTVLAAFTADDGYSPTGTLAQGRDGNFYGVTLYGGASSSGTIFRLTPAGVLTTLHSFDSNADGGSPLGGLILASDGNLYGTTNTGGPGSGGTVFKLDATGSPTVLHAFSYSGADGGNPLGPLVQGSDGALYGIAASGSDSKPRFFRLALDGTLTILHTGLTAYYDGAPHVDPPNGGLVLGRDGFFYGTASSDSQDGGLLFRFSAAGDLTILHVLAPATDGRDPHAGLALGANGNFYGTTSGGGANGSGTIYELASNGTFRVLHAFDATQSPQYDVARADNKDGANPTSALVQGPDGRFYGVTPNGGAAGLGTVFALTVHPAFFAGEATLDNGVYYLAFPDGNLFGYYAYLSDPAYIYHFDLGYEYVVDANDGKAGVYLYDFESTHFFYTSPTFPFPYLYDFTLNSVLYYYPDLTNPGHYNTAGTRYFYDFAAGKIITE